MISVLEGTTISMRLVVDEVTASSAVVFVLEGLCSVAAVVVITTSVDVVDVGVSSRVVVAAVVDVGAGGALLVVLGVSGVVVVDGSEGEVELVVAFVLPSLVLVVSSATAVVSPSAVDEPLS